MKKEMIISPEGARRVKFQSSASQAVRTSRDGGWERGLSRGVRSGLAELNIGGIRELDLDKALIMSARCQDLEVSRVEEVWQEGSLNYPYTMTSRNHRNGAWITELLPRYVATMALVKPIWMIPWRNTELFSPVNWRQDILEIPEELKVRDGKLYTLNYRNTCLEYSGGHKTGTVPEPLWLLLEAMGEPIGHRVSFSQPVVLVPQKLRKADGTKICLLGEVFSESRLGEIKRRGLR